MHSTATTTMNIHSILEAHSRIDPLSVDCLHFILQNKTVAACASFSLFIACCSCCCSSCSSCSCCCSSYCCCCRSVWCLRNAIIVFIVQAGRTQRIIKHRKLFLFELFYLHIIFLEKENILLSLSLSINNLIICQLIGLLKIYIFIVYIAVHCHSIICTARPQWQQVSSLIYVHTRKGVGGRKEAWKEVWEGQAGSWRC